jgi:hypothetical protein
MRTPTLAALVLALAAVPAAAQSSTAASPDLSVVRREMKKLIAAQEGFYSDNGRYSADLANLKLALPDSITIRLIDPAANAYSAIGSLKGTPAASCVMMIGTVAAPPTTAAGTVATAEGAIACDGDRAPTAK